MKKSLVLLLLVGFVMACQPDGSKQAEDASDSVEAETLPTMEQGKAITGAAFAALSKQLGAHMQSGGVPEAIKYCSVAALPLTDSLSAAHGVTIKRTALRLRNPKNAPTSEERAMLEKYEHMISEGNTPEPVLTQNAQGEWRYFQPILLMPLCSKCHGDVDSEIAPADLALIRGAYPADEAVNFEAGSLRGMWSLTF